MLQRDLLSYPEDDMGTLMADIYITAAKAAATVALVVCIVKAEQHAVFYGVSYAERTEN